MRDPIDKGFRPEGYAMKTSDVDLLDSMSAMLRDKRKSDVSLSEVVHLAEVTVDSLKTFFTSVDMATYRELRDIAHFITRMKTEVSTLQPNDLKRSRIPAAGLELDAIVTATEKATNTIMGCAELVMEADTTDPVAYKAMVDDQMMVIFEACSFQDITGQRVAKVIETLKFIESRVSRFAEVMQTSDAEGFLDEAERKRAERAASLILNGPAIEGGVDQADIDAMFN